MACIDLPAFPLQLLLRRERSWIKKPAVVVEEDKPLARILWTNEAARRFEILPGMRYAAALSLCGELCAGVVAPEEIETAVTRVCKLLRRFSPDVEIAPHSPGTVWLGAGGLQPLHRDLESWAGRLARALARARLLGHIVVGFSRFGSFALARTLRSRRPLVLKTAADERREAERVSLDRLSFHPKARDELTALGIEDVAGFLRLPPAGLHERFGPEVLRLHREARGEWDTPLQAEAIVEPVRQEALLDDPERDTNRLLFWIKRLLDPLLAGLVARRESLRELILELTLDRPARGQPEHRVERLAPAEPTVDAVRLLPLLLLKLEALKLRRGVVEIALDAVSGPATTEQLSLFFDTSKRDRRAAGRAFARLRAEYGDDTVVRAQLRPAHLPEAGFSWVPVRSLHNPKDSRRGSGSSRSAETRANTSPPAEALAKEGVLVRRMYDRPVILPRRLRHEEDGWQVRGRDDASVDQVLGPFVVSGGWWRAGSGSSAQHPALSEPIHREYHFLHNHKGEWLWAYYDRPRRRWFLQGRVE